MDRRWCEVVELKWTQTVEETHRGWIDGARQTVSGARTGMRERVDLHLAWERGWTLVTIELGEYQWCLWGMRVRSFERVCEKCKSFEGKIKPEVVLRVRRVILQSTQKMTSAWPNFQYIPNTLAGVKWFPEILFRRNKRSLNNNNNNSKLW